MLHEDWGITRYCVNHGALCKAAINSHPPCLQGRQTPRPGHRVADWALDSSYAEPQITSAQVETQKSGSEVSHLPETELCPNLK